MVTYFFNLLSDLSLEYIAIKLNPPAKSPLAFWTWNFGLNCTSPRLIDISYPNCPSFQRKPLLCLLLPAPFEMLSNPVNLPCGTNCWREFNIFWSCHFAFVLFIIIVIIIINIIIIIIIVIIIIIILLKLISAVVKDWFFSLGIYFCVFQEVAFNYNLCVNLHVEIQVKNKKGNK